MGTIRIWRKIRYEIVYTVSLNVLSKGHWNRQEIPYGTVLVTHVQWFKDWYLLWYQLNVEYRVRT
jgi:hypothetical protein